MRMLVALVALFATSVGYANGEVLHVRPTGACVENGDGTAYGCAASAGAEGAWIGLSGFTDTTRLAAATDTTGKIDPGDRLCVHGTYTTQFQFGGAAALGSGTAARRTIVDMDCPEEAGNIDLEPGQNFAISSSQCFVTWNKPRVDGPADLGTLIYFPEDTCTEGSIAVLGGYASNGTVDTGESALHIDGPNAFVDGFECFNMERYCVLTSGANPWVQFSRSLDSDGTCFVMDTVTEGGVYIANYCEQLATTDGNCYELNDTTGATLLPVLLGNECVSATIAAGGGALVKSGATILGFRSRGGSTPFSLESSGGAVVGPVVLCGVNSANAGNKHVGIVLAYTDVLVCNSTFAEDSLGTVDGINSFNGTAGIRYINNIFKNLLIGIDEQVSGSVNKNQYNVFHGNTTNRRVFFSPGMVDATSITDDPLLDANYRIGDNSPAWGAGRPIYPHAGESGKCLGESFNIGATCEYFAAYASLMKDSARYFGVPLHPTVYFRHHNRR